MKNICIFLIIIPLFLNYKFPDLNIDSNLNSLLNKLKTNIPEFIIDIRDKLEEFKEMTFETQQEVLEDLNSTIKVIIKEIKEEGENINEKLKEFIEKGTKIARFLTGRDCGILDYIPFYKCTDIKKYLLKHILELTREELKCSKIINLITTNLISNDLVYNLKAILFFVESLSSNPDAFIEGSAQILYDIINCIQENYDIYWPKIEKFLKIDEISSEIKKDSLFILFYSISNLVHLVRKEEQNGILTKLNGLIYNDIAKNLQKSIFSFAKSFNEFGTSFYNISSSLSLNVTINPGGLGLETDSKLFISNNNDKGIKIILHSNYLLRMKGAYSIQTIVFDSPLVSFRAKRETENKVSNIFVGITLYDKNGNEIIVSDINIDDFRPQILFEKKLYKAMKTCLFYNEEEDKLETSGIKTENNYILDGKAYIRCIPKHLTSFTIGISEFSFYNIEKIICISIIIIIIIVALIIGYICLRKKLNKNINSSEIENKDRNKKNYMGLEEEEK